MSRAKVIRKTAFQQICNSMNRTLTAIRSAGFPKEMADMSLPSFSMGVVSPLFTALPLPTDCMMYADSPIPLSWIEYPIGNTTFRLSENLSPAKGQIENVARPVIPNAASVIHSSKPNSGAVSVIKRGEEKITEKSSYPEAPVNIRENQEELEPDHDIVAKSIVAILKENSLETRTPETLSPNVTRIKIDDLLGQRKIRIPEYVMVRR